MDKNIWSEAILSDDVTIRQVIICLDQTHLQIVMIVDSSMKIVGTISDGDIRRGLIRGLSLENSALDVTQREPILVSEEHSISKVRDMMRTLKINQIPVVDSSMRVVGLRLWEDWDNHIKQNSIVVMAGGLGQRLRPITETCPKPLLIVRGKPILQNIIENARKEGFKKYIFVINYLGEMIEDYFGNGERFDIEIEYIRENSPLGTAGSLELIKDKVNEPIIITNGDLLTDINYSSILDYHNKHMANATMAVKANVIKNPYGVIKTDGLNITSIIEKPEYREYINAGVYVMGRDILKNIPSGEYFDMPDLFNLCIKMNEKVVAYPIYEEWIDIGRAEDLKHANS